MALRGIFADEIDNVFHSGARSEDFGNTARFQSGDVFVGNNSASKDYDVIETLLLGQFDDPRKQRHMRAGQDRKTDCVYILLDGRRNNLLRSLSQAGINNFHARIPKRTGNYLYSAIVAIKSRLREQDPYSLLRHGFSLVFTLICYLLFAICYLLFALFCFLLFASPLNDNCQKQRTPTMAEQISNRKYQIANIKSQIRASLYCTLPDPLIGLPSVSYTSTVPYCLSTSLILLASPTATIWSRLRSKYFLATRWTSA